MATDEALETFARTMALPDREIDLAGVALLIAQLEYPQLDHAAWLLQLDDLAQELRPKLNGESGYGVANTFSHFLFEEQQFRANTDDYYDPRNSYLNDVLERRLGIPITLSLIFLEVARRCGVTAHGIGLPGHFVVQVDADSESLLVDPFNGGVILTDEDCLRLIEASTGRCLPLDEAALRPVSNRDFVLRMLNNLRTIHLNAQDYERALPIVERIVLLQPDAREVRLRDALRRSASQ